MAKARVDLLVLAAAAIAVLSSYSTVTAADANKPAAPAEPNFAAMNPDEVMAKYDDQKLTLRDIEYFIPSPTRESARQLAQQWLDLEMLYAAAQKRGITQNPKAKFLAELNSKQLFSRELMNKIASEVNVPDAEIHEYYEKNKNTDPQLFEPNRLSFCHIKTKTLEDANAIMKRIEAGDNMQTIAKEQSFATDAATGGLVRRLPQAVVERQYGKEFTQALLASSEGKIIGPIKVPDGYYEIARHEGKLSAKPYPFDMVMGTIKSRLEQEAKTEATRKFIEDLKKQSQSKMYMSGLLEIPAPKVEEGKSGMQPNLSVDKAKNKTDNAAQKK
jgi:peptidyl-prolyl cis-trans isomerase C